MTRDRPSPGITIFAGRFGSGKTEAAIGYALSLAGHGQSGVQGSASAEPPTCDIPRPVLIDLDIVTPYFRSREAADALGDLGVDVVTPAEIGKYVDMPALTPEILGAIEQVDRPTVLDVGGDRQGARALSQFSAPISRRGYAMHFVVNTYRPFTDSLEGLAAAITEINTSSRLRVTSLVGNPNLMGETTLDLILAGFATIELYARQLGLPVAFLCAERRWAGPLYAHDLGRPVLLLDRQMVHPWEQRTLSVPGLRLPRA
jgi:hypothetical protein